MPDKSQFPNPNDVPREEDYEYLFINDLGDRVTVQRFLPRPALPICETRGYQSEKSVKKIALEWGFPENVYSPAVISKGSATREVSDLLLVSGKRALIVQVKSRNAENDDLGKVERWVKRVVRKATSQGEGSIRSITQSSRVFENGRSTKLSLRGNQFEVGVLVVLDIPAVPENLIINIDPDNRTLVITLTEFEFLFGHLKSVSAVIRYVFRVVSMKPIDLGSEMQRFMSLAMEDHNVADEKMAHKSSDGVLRLSTPILPLEPVGIRDEEAHQFFCDICEMIRNFAAKSDADPESLATVFGGIDDLPVQAREMIGRYLLNGLQNFQSEDDEYGQLNWIFRHVWMDEIGMRFVFGASKIFDPSRTNQMFQSRVQIIHHQFQRDNTSIDDKLSIGFLVTPRDSWPYFDVGLAAVDDRQHLSEDEFESLVLFWNQLLAPGQEPIG